MGIAVGELQKNVEDKYDEAQIVKAQHQFNNMKTATKAQYSSLKSNITSPSTELFIALRACLQFCLDM